MVVIVIINAVMLTRYFSKSNGNKYSFAAVTKAFAVTMLT